MPGGGVEPPRPEGRRILSPLRLPVPPSRLFVEVPDLYEILPLIVVVASSENSSLTAVSRVARSSRTWGIMSSRLPDKLAKIPLIRMKPDIMSRQDLATRSRGLASARESLCRGFGSRWFTERFHGNALVAHFQHGQLFCTAGHLQDNAVTRRRLHQRAPQR